MLSPVKMDKRMNRSSNDMEAAETSPDAGSACEDRVGAGGQKRQA